MIKILENKHSGFTFIEIIITLVIAAVVGTGLAQYLGTAFTTSAIPIQHLRQAFELQLVMENITDDYENGPSTLIELKSSIGSEGSINTNTYGQYTVVENKFIEFNSSKNEQIDTTEPKDLLKVTIKNESGLITTLFSSQ